MFACKKSGYILSATIAIVALCACNKTHDPSPVPATSVKKWDVVLNAKFENPAPAGRTETGTATLELFSDNKITFTIGVTGLAGGDNLTSSHIHWGDPLTNGPIVLNFNKTYTNNAITGEATISKGLADSLVAGNSYVNVHSSNFPGGLLRGQLNNPVDFAIDVPLSGANEVPAVTTTATGLALLRLTADKNLYSRVTVTNIEANDTATVAHIHPGAAGANGGVLQGLCASKDDFGIIKITLLDDAKVTALKTAALYVNAHSKLRAAGIVRGQIR
ncbi:MAG: CHRD domain-containing protein [Gemmatimonadaceae bacterium]|nr:CHRD domain-containing protein [Chitinophagaceae bacterium]